MDPFVDQTGTTKMKNYYLIQVENVLTEDQIVPAMLSKWLEDWIKTREVCLFSSLAFSEVIAQVRSSVTSKSQFIFTKNGRAIVDGKTSKVLYEEQGTGIPTKVIDWATKHAGNTTKTELRGSQFIRNHAGLLSVSPVGYDIDVEAIKKYQVWDKKNKERARLLLEFQATFPTLKGKLDSSVGIEIQSTTPRVQLHGGFKILKAMMF